MFFNSEDARNRAYERVAQLRKEAETRRFTASPKQTIARFIRRLAASLQENSQGDSYVPGKISRRIPARPSPRS